MPRVQPQFEPRYERIEQDMICEDCQRCAGHSCDPIRRTPLRSYGGIRLTSDGFDCALPVTIDSHSHCSYQCAYCFSEQLKGHSETRHLGVGQTSLRRIEAIFSGEGGGKFGEAVRHALKYDRKNEHGFPCPVQLGGINDPGDEIERNQGWLLEFIRLCVKYQQPVRISTKGTVLREPDYIAALSEAPHLFWVAFSIISPDDELMKKVDVGAPSPTDRLKTMAAVSKIGCKTSLRFRPIMPGVSDSTSRYPRAYQTLIDRAAEAGARAISAEVAFVPTGFNAEQRKKWDRMERAIGVGLHKMYSQFGKSQSCFRTSYRWTEDIMHSIVEVGHHNGMTIGISDPLWKELTDTGCCCGILPDDPVFGNWERENATNAMVRAKADPDLLLTEDDIIPPWSRDFLMTNLCNVGIGPKHVYAARHFTWAQKLSQIWNDPDAQRSPWRYFQGALQPEQLENGRIGYRYVGLEREHPKVTPGWRLLKPDLAGKPRMDCNACGSFGQCGPCQGKPRASLLPLVDNQGQLAATG